MRYAVYIFLSLILVPASAAQLRDLDDGVLPTVWAANTLRPDLLYDAGLGFLPGFEEDTTSSWRYFPLQIGNEWQYELFYPGTGDTSHMGYRVRADTLLEGRTYYALHHCFNDGQLCTSPQSDTYVRFDTTNALVIERLVIGGQPREEWWDEVPCALDAPFGSSQISCTGLGGDPQYFVEGGHDFNLVLPPDTVHGITFKEFDSIEVVMGVVADFGVVSRVYQKTPRPIKTLVYARIDRAAYGTPTFSFPTVSETVWPETSRSTLIYPNPAQFLTTVRFDAPLTGNYTIEVFDVRGRRLLSIGLGTLIPGRAEYRLDLGGLVQGTYIVMVENGGAEQRTTALLHVAR